MEGGSGFCWWSNIIWVGITRESRECRLTCDLNTSRTAWSSIKAHLVLRVDHTTIRHSRIEETEMGQCYERILPIICFKCAFTHRRKITPWIDQQHQYGFFATGVLARVRGEGGSQTWQAWANWWSLRASGWHSLESSSEHSLTPQWARVTTKVELEVRWYRGWPALSGGTESRSSTGDPVMRRCCMCCCDW